MTADALIRGLADLEREIVAYLRHDDDGLADLFERRAALLDQLAERGEPSAERYERIGSEVYDAGARVRVYKGSSDADAAAECRRLNANAAARAEPEDLEAWKRAAHYWEKQAKAQVDQVTRERERTARAEAALRRVEGRVREAERLALIDAQAIRERDELADQVDGLQQTLDECCVAVGGHTTHRELPATIRADKRAEAWRAMVDALDSLLGYAEEQECRHEETYRDGTLWTICEDCGQKWADDLGGFEPYEEPKAITEARAALAAAREVEGGESDGE